MRDLQGLQRVVRRLKTSKHHATKHRQDLPVYAVAGPEITLVQQQLTLTWRIEDHLN